MEITEHPPARPLGDPFWEAFRRRHPDVDVVLLPPEGPLPRERDERDERGDG